MGAIEEKLEPRLLTELLKEKKDVKRKLGKNREFYWYGRIN
jgi:hypothetical protein